MFRWVNGKNPRQCGFDFGLWTRKIVGELITQRFGMTLSLASVGALLARVGRTPQKPLQRAYQRDPEAIARWQRETYPAIARAAKRDNADIYFWDESGFRADAVHGKTWGAPELNPDELAWSHAKRTGNARRPLRAGECLEDRIQLQLAGMAAQPDLIRSFFRHPSVAYIADC